MREPDHTADITERRRYHIELLAASGYPAKLQRDVLAEILGLREALGRAGAVAVLAGHGAAEVAGR